MTGGHICDIVVLAVVTFKTQLRQITIVMMTIQK